MLDEQFNIKIADFDLYGPLEGRDGSGLLKTHCGTKDHMAPEILSGKPYNGVEVDVFSLGVILFTMYSGSKPFFRCASIKDELYRLMIEKD